MTACRWMRITILLLLTLLALPAWGAVDNSGTCTSSATPAACTAASYAALPGGQADATLCTATDTGMSWRYDSTTALWLPPDVNPAATLIDYTADALPGAAVPPWSVTTTGGTTMAVAAAS